MNSTKSKSSLLLTFAIPLALSLTACGSHNWTAHYEEAQKLSKVGDASSLKKAEEEYRTAITYGAKECPVEKDYAPAIIGLGQTLYAEHKFEESQYYLIRSLQLSSAINMPLEQNVDILRKLVVAYEQTYNYEEALNTQGVLLNLLAVEESPFRPEYIAENQKQQALKSKLASLSRDLATTPNSLSQ